MIAILAYITVVLTWLPIFGIMLAIGLTVVVLAYLLSLIEDGIWKIRSWFRKR